MLTPADIGYDMLGSGPGLRFTQLQVWIGSKKAPVRGRAHKNFRVVSEPGRWDVFVYGGSVAHVNGRQCS
jgi:hypothetical protein